MYFLFCMELACEGQTFAFQVVSQLGKIFAPRGIILFLCIDHRKIRKWDSYNFYSLPLCAYSMSFTLKWTTFSDNSFTFTLV